MILEPVVLSKEYLDTVRILLRVASDTTDLMIADLLRALADNCVRHAAKRSQAESSKACFGRSLRS